MMKASDEEGGGGGRGRGRGGAIDVVVVVDDEEVLPRPSACRDDDDDDDDEGGAIPVARAEPVFDDDDKNNNKPEAPLETASTTAAAPSPYGGGGAGGGEICWRRWRNRLVCLLAVAVLLTVIVVAAVFGSRSEGYRYEDSTAVTTTRGDIYYDDDYDNYDGNYDGREDFYYGQGDQTRIAYYGVNTTIDGRLATNKITVDVTNDVENNSNNENNCTAAVRGITLQLPRNARVTGMTSADNLGCQLESEVQSIQLAEKTFDDLTSEGKPAAMVKAWDSTEYQVSVTVPANGRTRLTLVVEELLRRRLGIVEFQLPVSPHAVVDNLVVDVAVVADTDGQGGGAVTLELEKVDPPDDNVTDAGPGVVIGYPAEDEDAAGDVVVAATAHYEAKNVSTPYLPRILRGRFDPGPLASGEEEGGALHTSGNCFEHVFSYDGGGSGGSAGTLPRAIVFVIDLSGSMSGEKLQNAKDAFAHMIGTSLTEADTLAVQTFSDAGTEDLWGPSPATEANVERARNYVYSLGVRGYTNLNDAYLDAVRRAKGMATDGRIPIVLFMTDGQASAGEQDSRQIARNVASTNSNEGDGGRVKIFSLAFGHDAAMDLLQGIALMNDGIATKIFDDFDDSKEQMTTFYESELGTILLSDVTVKVGGDGDFRLKGETNPSFPVLPAGSEVVVRGLVETASGNSSGTATASSTIQANTTARTPDGYRTWSTEAATSPLDQASGSRCHQSYAHSRVEELMRFRDAARLLGDDLREYLPKGLDCYGSLDACVEREALSVALDAGLVWPELTALVTVENEDAQCKRDSDKGGLFDDEEEVELCYEGTGLLSGYGLDDAYDEGVARTVGAPSSSSGGNGAPMVGSAPAESVGGNGRAYYASGAACSPMWMPVLCSLLLLLSFYPSDC